MQNPRSDKTTAEQSGQSPPKVVTTQPEHILRHSISDEELEMLSDSKTDFVLEILLLSVGAMLGTLPVAVSGMFTYLATPNDAISGLELVDFIQIVLFWAGVTVAVSVGLIYRKKSRKANSVQDEIRDRAGVRSI